jgi:hypothetical protein
MTGRPFQVSVSVTLDGSGNSPVSNGTSSLCRFAPVGESWTVNRVTVSCSSRTKEALCVTYQRFISAATEVGRTYSGSSGDTSADEIPMTDGDSLHVVWTGGVPGATATAVIYGTATVMGRGFRAV